MKIKLTRGDESEELEVSGVEHGTFQTTENHDRFNKVPHKKGDNYTKITGIQPSQSDLLDQENFVWLSGSMAGRGSSGNFPLVYIPEGYGYSVTVK